MLLASFEGLSVIEKGDHQLGGGGHGILKVLLPGPPHGSSPLLCKSLEGVGRRLLRLSGPNAGRRRQRPALVLQVPKGGDEVGPRRRAPCHVSPAEFLSANGVETGRTAQAKFRIGIMAASSGATSGLVHGLPRRCFGIGARS